jgi:hypothetical protein
MMAHFAEIDENNLVLRVLVVDNDKEDQGQDYLANELGLGGTWVQTSYNKTFRKNYAGIGFTYDPDLDAFIPPICHEEASLDLELFTWNCENKDHEVPTQ